jgi:hypothetical protein
MVDSPLTPNAGNQLTTPAQMQYSPAFLKADAEMAKLAGDKVPQSLRYQYWQALNGDQLAAIDPRAAALAYDTAIMTSPQKAFELVQQTGGDPAKMYQARNTYAQQMVAKDPQKYGPMEAAFKQHNENIGRSLGLIPAANQQGQAAPAAAPAPPGSLKELIDRSAAAAGISPRKMYGIVAGESGHGDNYDTNVSDREASYGPFQLNIKGGLGNQFEKETGLKVTDPNTIPAQATWVANYLAKNPNMNVGGTWFGYHGDTDWNPKWGNAGYLGGEGAAANPSASKQTPSQTKDGGTPDKPAEPEKSAFEQAADAVSSGIAGAAEAKKPEAAPAIPTTKPTISLPTGPIAPSQRDMYAKALDAISKRNAATPPTQPAKPADAQEKEAPTASTPAPTPEKEAATPNDEQA